MSQEPQQGAGKSFFERHPKKTLAVLVGLALLVLAFIADKLVALKVKPQGPSIQRYVRLRELNPLTFEVITPNPRVFDTEAGSPPRQVVIRVDANGFIIPSQVHAKPDLVLAFLGGSTTECRAVPEDSRFAYLVGRCLERTLKLPVNSYNAARSGNNSLHSLDILLNKVMPLNPDIVVMMHNINDLITLMYEKTYWNKNPNRRVIIEIRPTLVGEVRGFFRVLREYTFPNLYRAWKDLVQRSRGTQPEFDEFRHIRGKKIELNQTYFLKEFRRNLQMFVALCRARQITPVLMTQANRMVENLDSKTWQEVSVLEAQGIKYAEFRKIYRRFNQTIREVGALNRVTVVDLAQEIPSVATNVYDVVHLTERASKQAAQIICRKLKPLAETRLAARDDFREGGQRLQSPAPAPDTSLR